MTHFFLSLYVVNFVSYETHWKIFHIGNMLAAMFYPSWKTFKRIPLQNYLLKMKSSKGRKNTVALLLYSTEAETLGLA